MKFILGFDYDNHDNFNKLTQYKTVKEADYNSEEWCVVESETLEEAKGIYEKTFSKLREEGRINGCM